MFQSIPSGIKFKLFVKETNNEDSPEKFNASRKYFPVSSLTGDKAKEFYEDILKEPGMSEEKKFMKPKPRLKSKPVQNKTYKNVDLLWMAQNNDVKSMRNFFSQEANHDVNIVDDFGWTPLMCASCSGAEEAVEMLLKNGADPYKCDKLGTTAFKLAQQKNQMKIMQMLQNVKKKQEGAEGRKDSKDTVELFFCSVCKENFKMNRNKHESSTLHLFNSQLKTPTFYGIPECNKGFQLLLREGWDKERGLGPNGTGRKFPVKAVMKKDRLGIGAQPQGGKNKQEIQHTQKYESKKKRINNTWKEKDFEKNFRLEFS